MSLKTGLLGFLICLGSTCAQENYSRWSYYKSITVNTSASGANIPGNVTGFPVLVRLTSANTDVFSNSVGRGKDLRFSKSNGATALKYQIERWDSAAKAAEIWVLVDTVYANNSSQSIRMYWGKSGAADSSKSSSVFAAGNNYVGVWHMEGDSSNVADATGAGFYGTNYGTTNTAGVVGTARSFFRSSPTAGQFIRIFNSGNNPKFDQSLTSTTISLWVNGTDWGTSSTNRGYIICRGTSSFKYILIDTAFDNVHSGMWWGINPTAGNNGSPAKTASSLSLGDWHLIHGIYNPSANNIGLYVDGDSAASAPGNAAYALSPWDVHIGSRGYGNAPGGTEDHFFNGMIDEVRIQSAVRSPSWIKLEYQNQKTGSTILTLGSTQTPTVSLAIITDPASQTVAEGSQTFLFVASSGKIPLTYQWIKNGTDTVAGATRDTLKFASVQLSDSGSYKCVVRDSTGFVVSNSAVLGVMALPFIVSHPANQSVAVGGAAKFGISVTGTSLFREWIKNDVDTLTRGTGDTLTLNNVQAADYGSTYKCRILNPAGAVVSHSATLNAPVSLEPNRTIGKDFVLKISNASSRSFHIPVETFRLQFEMLDLHGKSVWSQSVEPSIAGWVLDATTLNGRVASGVYFTRLTFVNGSRKQIGVLEGKIAFAP